MAVLENHFYHRTISLLTGVFGSIFDEVKIARANGTIIRVPISYAVKRKYNVRNEQNPTPNEIKIKMQLPRMSFKLNSLVRDPVRLANRMYKLTEDIDRTNELGVKTQYNRVPFLFNYTLSLKTKTIDDMLQLIEQIVVYFNPSLRVIVKDNPELDYTSAITVKILDTGVEDISEGSFEGEESLEANMQFELEGWLYMPTATTKVITKSIINVFDSGTGELLEHVVEVP